MTERSRFWKICFGSGGVTLVRTLCALVTNKLFAVFLSPALFACVGQFQNIFSIGQASSSLAMQNGWVSLTARYKKNRNGLPSVWGAGIRLMLGGSLLMVIAAFLFCFAAPLGSIFPGIPERLAQAAILFAIPGVIAANAVLVAQSVMNGLSEYRRWALIGLVTSVLQCAWVAVFLCTGFLSVLSIIATQSFVSAVFALVIARRGGFSLSACRAAIPAESRAWLKFAAMGLVPMVLSPVALTLVRSAVGGRFGWDAAGIWQSVWRVSDFFSVAFSSVLGVLILPEVSAELSPAELWKKLRPLLARVLVLAAVSVAVIFALREWIVLILFAKPYAAAADYLPIQLAGDFFRAGGWCLGLVLIARQAMKTFVIAETLSQIFFAVLAIAGMFFWDFRAPMIAYACENALYFFGLLAALRFLPWKSR